MTSREKLVGWASAPDDRQGHDREFDVAYASSPVRGTGWVCAATWCVLLLNKRFGVYGFGQSPEAAEDDCWRHLVESGLATEA